MKIECSRQLCAERTDGQTDGQSDTLSSCRSQKCSVIHIFIICHFVTRTSCLKLKYCVVLNSFCVYSYLVFADMDKEGFERSDWKNSPFIYLHKTQIGQ